jgi:hypothetical protein
LNNKIFAILVEVSETYTSSINQFNSERLNKGKQIIERIVRAFNPYLMTGSAHKGGVLRL